LNLFGSTSKGKKRWTPLPRGGHPQTTGDLFIDHQEPSTSHTATGPGPEEEQVYTPLEGEAQTFTTEQQPLPSFDHLMAEQPQQQPQMQPQQQEDPLQAVINAAVQTAMTYQACQQPQQQQLPVASGKNYKIADQVPFDGKPEQIESFLLECEMRFIVLPNEYDTVDKQVFYTLSLMKSGIAKAWKDQYLASRKGQHGLAYVVFGSPVWSGLLTPRAMDRNRNRSIYFQFLKKTGPNRYGPVHIGFFRLQNRSEPVTVQTGSQPV